jgi:hypothetical protein
MTTFLIDEEIDKLIDRLSEQLRSRLKKLVDRSERLVLKQYIASQKETARVSKIKTVAPGKQDKKGPAMHKIRRPQTSYGGLSDDSFSESD